MRRHAVQRSRAGRKDPLEIRWRGSYRVLRRATNVQPVAGQQGKGMVFACVDLRLGEIAPRNRGRVDQYQHPVAFCLLIGDQATILRADIDGRCRGQSTVIKNIAELALIIRLKKNIVAV